MAHIRTNLPIRVSGSSVRHFTAHSTPFGFRLMRLRPNKTSSITLMLIRNAEKHIVGIKSGGNYNGSKKYFHLLANKWIKILLLIRPSALDDIAINSHLYFGSVGQNAATLQRAKLVLVLIESPIHFNISSGTAGCSCRSLFNSYPELGGMIQLWFSWLFSVLNLVILHLSTITYSRNLPTEGMFS